MEKQDVWPPHWLSSKESDFNMGDTGEAGVIPGLGRSPGGEHDNPLQYSCLENPTEEPGRPGPWGCKESDTMEATKHQIITYQQKIKYQ